MVEIEQIRFSDIPDEIKVSVSRDGKQWTSVRLTPQEAEEVITAIEGYLSAQARIGE